MADEPVVIVEAAATRVVVVQETPAATRVVVVQETPEAVATNQVVDEPVRVARVFSGPPGPSGIIKVAHGADPNMSRPVDAYGAPVALVYWVGSVSPVNAYPDDLFMLK